MSSDRTIFGLSAQARTRLTEKLASVRQPARAAAEIPSQTGTVRRFDLSELEGELAMHAEDTMETKTKSLRNLLDQATLIPMNPGKHVDAHLKYVFASLQALARHSS